MSTVYQQDFLVDSRAVDLTGYARPSALLGYLQEAATRAALELHASSPEVLEKYNCLWMVVRSWYHLDKPLYWNEHFTVRTWHRGGKGASSYRDYDLLQDGAPIGEGTSLWALVDVQTGKLLHMDRFVEFQGTGGGALCKTKTLHRLKLPALPQHEERPMRYSDTDINGHINNSRYADFACDALRLEERLPGKFVSQFQIGYLNQCKAGEVLSIETGEDGGSLYARGLGPGEDRRFECAVTLAEGPSFSFP